MPTSHRIRRTAVLGALGCTLLGSAGSGVAAAQADRESRVAAAEEQAQYYASQPGVETHPQAQYYASFGEAEPLTLPQSPAPSDDTPWLVLALGSTAAVATVSVAALQRRRLRRLARLTTA